ncbi:HNH endonuclease [Candidatus Saccharibacteria bacterium]|nr:HNH endonuclease [Candidatus Saccharibacteria bacterium]
MKELSELKNIRALLAVYFNLCDEDENYFIINSEYRISTFQDRVEDYNFSIINYQLKNYFGLNFKSDHFGKHVLKIQKTAIINTSDTFLTEIYRLIQLLSFEVDSQEYEEAIILALFVLRGSADFSMQYYAVDIYRRFSTKGYLRNIFQLLSSTSAISRLNLNFREYQPQYTNGTTRRNTQVRIKLGWFWNNYGNKLSDINVYKYSILNSNRDKISAPTSNVGNFSDRLIEYMSNILGEKTDEKAITKERKRLGLQASGSPVDSRNFNLKTIANNVFPDECMGCKDKYNNEQRTFRLRNQDKHYFEIHHVIPFSKGKEHDQIDNLAKLCAICHRVLTKNRAEEDLQKKTIENILNSSDNTLKYVSILVGNTNKEQIINYVYSKLA